MRMVTGVAQWYGIGLHLMRAGMDWVGLCEGMASGQVGIRGLVHYTSEGNRVTRRLLWYRRRKVIRLCIPLPVLVISLSTSYAVGESVDEVICIASGAARRIASYCFVSHVNISV